MEMNSFHPTYLFLTCCMLMLLFRPGQGSTMRIHVYPDSDNRLDVSISTNLTTSVTSGCLERCYSNSQRITVSGRKYCRSGWSWCIGWDYTATVQNSEFKIDISRYDYAHEVRLYIMCRNTNTSLFMCGDKQTTQAVTRITRGDTTYDVECTQASTHEATLSTREATLSTREATLSTNASSTEPITTSINSTITSLVSHLSPSKIITTTASSGVQPEEFSNQSKPVSSLAIVLPIVILVILVLVTLSIIYIRRRRYERKGDSSQPSTSPGEENDLDEYRCVTSGNTTTTPDGEPQNGEGDNISYHLMEIRPTPAEPDVYAEVIKHANHTSRTPLYENPIPIIELVDNDLYESSQRDENVLDYSSRNSVTK